MPFRDTPVVEHASRRLGAPVAASRSTRRWAVGLAGANRSLASVRKPTLTLVSLSVDRLGLRLFRLRRGISRCLVPLVSEFRGVRYVCHWVAVG